MTELRDVMQVLTPALLAVAGWGLKLIWSELRRLADEQRAYVTKEMCAAHRETFQRQLNEYAARLRTRSRDAE